MVSWDTEPKPKTRPVHIPEDTHRAFKVVCARRGLSMQRMMNELIWKFIEHIEHEDKAKGED